MSGGVVVVGPRPLTPVLNIADGPQGEWGRSMAGGVTPSNQTCSIALHLSAVFLLVFSRAVLSGYFNTFGVAVSFQINPFFTEEIRYPSSGWG